MVARGATRAQIVGAVDVAHPIILNGLSDVVTRPDR
jgi:hypothetical protein